MSDAFLLSVIYNLFQFPLSPFPSYCRWWSYTRRLRFTIQQYRLLTHLLHYIISQLLQCHFSLNLLQFFQQIEWDIWDKKTPIGMHKKGFGAFLVHFFGHKKSLQDWKSIACRLFFSVWTGLEPATPCVTGRYSNQLNYHTIVALSIDLVSLSIAMQR